MIFSESKRRYSVTMYGNRLLEVREVGSALADYKNVNYTIRLGFVFARLCIKNERLILVIYAIFKKFRIDSERTFFI